MEIKSIKKILLFIIAIILIYIFISWYLLRFVKPPVNTTLIIAIYTPVFAGLVGVVIRMVDGLIQKAEKRRQARDSLREKIDEIIKYPLNTNEEHYLEYIPGTMLLISNLFNLPAKIENKKAEYNKKAEDLITLYHGCDYLVRDMITKNVLMYLSEINVLKDDKNNIIQWEMTGYGREQKLSDLLYSVLKEGIIKGDKIDKPFFDSVDSRFHVKILQHTSAENFENFLRHLTKDINYHRKYGCLKLFARLYKEVKEHAEEVRSDKYVKK